MTAQGAIPGTLRRQAVARISRLFVSGLASVAALAGSAFAEATHDFRNRNEADAPALSAFVSAMHVHTSFSSGRYDLPTLTDLAKERNTDVVFLSDSLTESIEYGLFPLRHIFWANYHRPSVTTAGPRNYFEAIRKENERQKDVLYIPGVEIVPRFRWSGSLRKGTLVCRNHQRNIIALGLGDADALHSVPVANGFVRGRHTGWIALTRAALLLFLAACLAAGGLALPLAKRSGIPALAIAKAFFLVLVLPSALFMVVLNVAAARQPAFDLYGPDRPDRHEQKTIDALNRLGIPHFWAHPEAFDRHSFSLLGVPFKVETDPYPDLLEDTVGYTGFAGVNEGRNKLIEPGKGWDRLLNAYRTGQRDAPVWCFGEMLYHYEGQARTKKLGNVETVIWAREKSSAALLESIRQGRFYARRNFEGQKLNLDVWGVQFGTPTVVELAVSSATPGVEVELTLIRNGVPIRNSSHKTPFTLAYEASSDLDQEEAAYYRVLIEGPHPLRIASNPLFGQEGRKGGETD